MTLQDLVARLATAAAGLALVSAPAFAQCPADDNLEENDSCGFALPLAPGTYPGLSVLAGDDDWYRITLPPHTDMAVDALFTHPSSGTGDIDMQMFAADCTTAIDQAGTATDNEAMDFSNITSTPFDVLVLVKGYGTNFTCNDYDLIVTTRPTLNGCATSFDDIYEPNDSCATAVQLPYGNYQGLITKKAPSDDWFEILVPINAAVDISVDYAADVQANVQMQVYDSCNGSPVGSVSSSPGNETVVYENFSGSQQTVYLNIYIWSFAQIDCNSYDLSFSLVGSNFFTSYCAGDGGSTPCPCGNTGSFGQGCANSSGIGSKLDTAGSNYVLVDDAVFSAAGLLPGQPALLFAGENAVGGGNGVMFGDGLRCAGSNVVRLGVQVPDSQGAASWGPGFVAQQGWVAGDTRMFQVWYRDPAGSPCGAGFNLSSAVETTFQM